MILHIDLDAFFASIEVRDNPGLAGKPLIVGGPFSPGERGLPRACRGVVATASYEARKYGIHSGMPLSKAIRACPQAILVAGNFFKYEKASDQFIRICSSFTPNLEQISLDEIFLDLCGTESLWQSPLWVAKEIQSKVAKEIEITCSAGVAAQKIVAKIASGIRKPNGVTLVPEGKEKEFLALLPLSKLPGCGEKTRIALGYYGVRRIGELAAMHPEHVRLLLGKNGLYLWEVANGLDAFQVTPPQPAKSTGRSTTFPFDTDSRDFILAMLYYLAQRVAKDLRDAGNFGKCIAVTARTADFITLFSQQTLPYSINTAHEIFQSSKAILDKLWDGQTNLRLVGVSVSQFQPEADPPLVDNQFEGRFLAGRQLHLIESASWRADAWFEIEEAMDRIRDKFGFLSIFPASFKKLAGVYPAEHRGFKLATPSLSR